MTSFRLMHTSLTLLFLLGFQTLFAQTEWATISLDDMRGGVEEILQFSDDDDNLLLQIKGNKGIQFNLFHPDKSAGRQSFKLWSNKHYLLESLYDKRHFILFYEKRGDRSVYQYQTEKKSLSGQQLLRTNVGAKKEKRLANAFIGDDFLIFNYTLFPLTLHTYRYDEQRHFEKESRVFEKDKQEFFWGNIQLEEEIIIVRYSRKPLTMHLYRYFAGRGFVKKSFEVKPAYEKAGRNTKMMLAVGANDLHTPISAYVDGDEIYLDMDRLLGTISFKNKRNHPYPDVLRLNWQTQESQLLSFGEFPLPKFKRRNVALLDSLYFQLLINKKQLDLMIYHLKDQRLLKKHSYTQDDLETFIHGPAQMEKEYRLNTNRLGVFPLYNEKKITSKKVLKELAKGETIMEVYDLGEYVELRVSGENEKTIGIAWSGFVSYLSTADLEAKKPSDGASGKIEAYLKKLDDKGHLGAYLIYEYQDKMYLAYIHDIQKVCKIIEF